MIELSILIPSRNEPLLQKTIEDIERNKRAATEVLYEEDTVPIGQRALTNKLARRSQAPYLMKVDAHCSFGPGFDEIMLSEIDDRTILAPQMGVLDPLSWSINGKKMTQRYCFDSNFVMQYDEQNGEKESMCLQGSAWMISAKNYWDWNICDESLGSWGGQAAELGIKAYLNDGVCRSTSNTYYGHVFRHSSEEFPYDRGDNPGKFATEELKRRYFSRIKGLVEKFNYPADWGTIQL